MVRSIMTRSNGRPASFSCLYSPIAASPSFAKAASYPRNRRTSRETSRMISSSSIRSTFPLPAMPFSSRVILHQGVLYSFPRRRCVDGRDRLGSCPSWPGEQIGPEYRYASSLLCFFQCPQPCGLFCILYPQEEGPVAGLGVREDDKIPVKADRDRGDTNSMDIEYLESRFDIDRFGKMTFDILTAFLEGRVADQDLVIERFYAAHGATSSITFFSGRGLCTAFAAIFVQGKVIWPTRSPWCSP